MLFGFPKLPCFNDENHDILAVQFDQRAYLVFRDAIHACKVADFIGFIRRNTVRIAKNMLGTVVCH
ncbi:hypothetical protein LCM4577_10345 [Mesorhizobium sp. LCM 4577]|nr:hypothetical protein LCM4576_33035 [Mesorhizobium sp. LCM 4576]OHV63718.1 hypothetical protein LCM4577_10345 [Mesorhizobium sp. LCM 4577]